MVIEVVRKPKKKPLKSVDPVLRRAVEVTISNEKAAEEAKKEEDAKRVSPFRGGKEQVLHMVLFKFIIYPLIEHI